MAEIKDQENATGGTFVGFGDTGNGRDYMAQGFIPTLDNVTAVSFHVGSKDGNADVGYRVWIDEADANSNPQNAVGGIGGSTLIDNATINTGGLTKYTLTAPATGLTPGNRYCIVIAPWNTNTNAWASSYNDFNSSVANPYASGRRVHLDGSFANPTAPDSGNADIVFETYGLESVSRRIFNIS